MFRYVGNVIYYTKKCKMHKIDRFLLTSIIAVKVKIIIVKYEQ